MSKRIGRVGETIRRIVASELEAIDDDRLNMVSITGVDVDRALHRAIVWFTALDFENESVAAEALGEHAKLLRKAVSSRTRLRYTPLLEFRPDSTLRSAQRIEEILRGD